MNLCIVSSGDFFSDYGGGQVYVRNIVDAFIEKKQAWDLQLSVISFHRNFPTTATSKDYSGIPIYEINPEGDIEALLSDISPDIVHANGEKLRVARTCQHLAIPCVVTAHHGGIVCPAGALLNTKDEICTIPADYKHCLHCYLRNTPTGLWWYPLLKRIKQEKLVRIGYRLKKLPFIPFLTPILETGLIVSNKLKDWRELSITATHFIAPSNAIADALIRNGCPSSKITVIPHGIPINSTQASLPHSIRKENPSKINFQLSTFNFYYAGRICYIKGVHVLLQAFHTLPNANAILHIIGDSEGKKDRLYHSRLKRKYRSDNRIIWHGKIPAEKLNTLICDFDALIHPAICLEVFGLDIAEALASGKYIIATRCGGAEMQIHNENEGVLLPPNDSAALLNAIEQYIINPQNSKATIQSIEEHVSRLNVLFKSTLTIHLQ